MVERFHVTLRKALISKFLEENESFDIEESLRLIVNIYNNTIHSVTQHTPFEIFYSKDENFHEKIYQNTIVPCLMTPPSTLLIQRNYNTIPRTPTHTSLNDTTYYH